MGRSSLITAEAVFAVADAIVAEGRTPSLRAIRESLGGGSFATILPFLRSWRLNNESQASVGHKDMEDLPPAVMASLDGLIASAAQVADAVSEAWNPAWRSQSLSEVDQTQHVLAHEVEDLRRQMNEKIAALKAELAVSEAGRAQAERELVIAKQRIEELSEWRRRAIHHMRTLKPKVTG